MERPNRAQTASRSTCSSCHHRKVKCDAQEIGFPCTACKNASPESCRLYQKRKRVSARPPGPSPTVLRRPEDTPLSARVQLTPIPLPPETNGADVPRPSSSTVPSHDGEADIPGLDLHDTSGGECVYRRHLVEFIDQPRLTERPIDRDARLTYVGTEVSNLNFLVQQQYGGMTDEVFHYPSNRFDRRHTIHEPDRLPVEAFQLPEKPVVDRLLEAYFTHINPGFPVVDEHLFMRQYRARDPQHPPSLFLLHAILMVGAHVSYDQPERDAVKALFFRRAKSLFDARFERDRDTLVQAMLLLTWQADGPEDVTAGAWFWIGAAVRTAMGMGMHRDAENSTLVPHNKRMYRRTWWLLFQCDVYVSLQYGRPQSIHLEDADVQPLKSSDFDDCGPHTHVEYVMRTTELCIIISRALRQRFRINPDPLRQRATLAEIDEALASWYIRLPPPLQIVNDVWAANLQLIYNMVLIILHRTQPAQTRPVGASAARREDSEICLTAANTIQSIFERVCERNEMKALWISSINSLFTALIQLNIETRSSDPILAISALQKYSSALGSLAELAKFWRNAQLILVFFETSLVAARGARATRNDATGLGILGGADLNSNKAGCMMPETLHGGQSEDGGRDVISTEVHADSAIEQPINTHVEATSGVGAIQTERTAWQEWRQTHWQDLEFVDDFLFTF
ncbi:putative fungal-specific transcription factor [Xylariaceae sp. FL0016]|nr:putative fungal-specific transcription factor [Xylariaceae sp. FL0016]